MFETRTPTPPTKPGGNCSVGRAAITGLRSTLSSWMPRDIDADKSCLCDYTDLCEDSPFCPSVRHGQKGVRTWTESAITRTIYFGRPRPVRKRRRPGLDARRHADNCRSIRPLSPMFISPSILDRGEVIASFGDDGGTRWVVLDAAKPSSFCNITEIGSVYCDSSMTPCGRRTPLVVCMFGVHRPSCLLAKTDDIGDLLHSSCLAYHTVGR